MRRRGGGGRGEEGGKGRGKEERGGKGREVILTNAGRICASLASLAALLALGKRRRRRRRRKKKRRWRKGRRRRWRRRKRRKKRKRDGSEIHTYMLYMYVYNRVIISVQKRFNINIVFLRFLSGLI